MTAALTPALALDYVRELSADVRAGVVLAPDGSREAGSEALATPARALLAALPDADEIEVATAEGLVFAARSPRRAVVLVCGRLALSALHRHDLRTILAELDRPPSEAVG